MAEHRHGTALIFARTETELFFETVWRKASAVLFLAGRLTFCRPDGKPGRANAGAPSVLVAYGADDAARLRLCGLDGQFIDLAAQPVLALLAGALTLLDRGQFSAADLLLDACCGESGAVAKAEIQRGHYRAAEADLRDRLGLPPAGDPTGLEARGG